MTADLSLVLAILMAFAFALTNGFHDAANSIATLVATAGGADRSPRWRWRRSST